TTSQPSTPPPGTAQLSPPLSSPLSEVELLRRARDLLERDPNGTLRWVERHRAQYPHGKLEQEREVLAVEALRRLGRDAEAARRAGAFVSEHPESAHKTRLERTPNSESPPPASTH
ncbi:MAG TPA: hypothetical protein VLC09_06540, partial [Polyangiaceae bacterium]|nr:hypothetical protein [Polyangiaceae bacterium]